MNPRSETAWSPAFPARWRQRSLPASVVLVFAVLAAPVAGLLVVRGQGPLALGGLGLALCFLLALTRWQRGYYGLLVYMPFAGMVTLALYPWQGPPLLAPLVFKDLYFALPAYLGFAAVAVLRRHGLPRFEHRAALLLVLFCGLVAVQTLNPGVAAPLMAVIGLKVWLFYMPLYALTASLLVSRVELYRLLRLLVGLAILPCLFGLTQYGLGKLYGHREVMEAIYGETAARVTQEFTVFEVGGAYLAPRIPATFSSVTQYFAYTLATLVPCYILSRADPSRRWRRFALAMLILVAVSSLLSGARAAFLFVPLLLGLTYALDRGWRGALRGAPLVAGVLVVVVAILGVSPAGLFDYMAELVVLYGQETAYTDLVTALTSSPFGGGTGTNTGPARHAVEDPESFVAIENYYAKAVLELGLPGLALLWMVFASLIIAGLRAVRRLRDPALRTMAAALSAFLLVIAVNCFKGWLMDLDPINVYFWVFAGIIGRLHFLEAETTREEEA